jgi:hypothetical protein
MWCVNGKVTHWKAFRLLWVLLYDEEVLSRELGGGGLYPVEVEARGCVNGFLGRVGAGDKNLEEKPLVVMHAVLW